MRKAVRDKMVSVNVMIRKTETQSGYLRRMLREGFEGWR